MGNVIEEARCLVWANFQRRALDVAILEINVKTDLKIMLDVTANTYKNFVCRAATKDHTFASAQFHRFLP